MLSLQIKSVINATAFINKNQSGNKPWLVSWKVHRHRQLHVSFLLHVPSLGGFKGFRKLSLCSGLVLIGNIKQYKPAKRHWGLGNESLNLSWLSPGFTKQCTGQIKPRPSQSFGGNNGKWLEGRNGEIDLCGGKKVPHCEKLPENYPLQRWFFFPCPACLHLHFGVLCPLHLPACFLHIGHHLCICVLPWCLRNSADTDSRQLHESQSAWLGHMGYNSPKTPLGNINAGKSDCEFPLSWLTPKNASLPPSLSVSLGSAQTVSLHSKSISCFCFQGLCMVLFSDALLIPSATLIFPRSVSHPKNSSVPTKLTELIWQGS